MPTGRDMSPLEKQAADALRRARRLPIGPSRNDLRQLAIGLLWLHRNGMKALEQARANTIAGQDKTLADDWQVRCETTRDQQAGPMSRGMTATATEV
jgi:hypothetical protein